MARRFYVRPRSDKAHFAHTADKTRLVNTGIVVPRGGIRL